MWSFSLVHSYFKSFREWGTIFESNSEYYAKMLNILPFMYIFILHIELVCYNYYLRLKSGSVSFILNSLLLSLNHTVQVLKEITVE